MSKSTDPDHFFQTSHSLAETNRKARKSKNNHGVPIRLQSKILAILADPTHASAVYVAESVGTGRRVVLETGETIQTYCGPTTPLTSLALSSASVDATLFAGSWDKTIWSWNTTTSAPQRRYFGHLDFVKALLCLRLNGTNLLISGAADASIVIWNAENGEKLHTLRGRTRGVLDLAVDPTTYPPSPLAAQEGTTFFSAGSDKEIRRWRITSDVSSVSEIETEKPILQHETSVYKLQFDVDDDLWTASADGTVKCLSRERGWEADTVLVHGDYIRAVVIDERGGWIASAGRDEDIKIWDRGSGKLHHTFSGHFEEITGMVLVGQTVVTVSIDATVRQWSLKPEDLRKAVKKAEEASNRVEEEAEEKVDVAEKKVLMTADEERELAELMSSDSD